MQIAKDTVVSFNYRLQDGEGQLLDESPEDQPLVYLHGHGGLIPGMENALDGREAGDSFSCEIPPEEGYGQHDPGLDLEIPLDQFSAEDQPHLQPGVRFQGPHPAQPDQPVIYQVHERNDDSVRVSGNHPLAGVTLHFEVSITEVRAATAEEIEHGHVHGPGGHHH